MSDTWSVHNPEGKWRVVVTKALPGNRWLEILVAADCRVEVCGSREILTPDEIVGRIGSRCDGAIGQLTEAWTAPLFRALASAGGRAFSNMAVGYDNVDVSGASAVGVAVGNTPGVLTETTAEMAVALTLAAARRLVEADRFMRGGHFHGWLPNLFMGRRLFGRTVGIVGAGRIGSAYARMMVEGFKMNLVYFGPRPHPELEASIQAYGDLLARRGEPTVTARRSSTLDELLEGADVVSLHTALDGTTRHLIDAARLSRMKEDAVLINTSRGAVIDEAALVEHCRRHPEFRVGLDVFEDEPAMKPGLAELDNVTVVPHIASASLWTRVGMATLAAANVAAVLQGHPIWKGDNVLPFLDGDLPAFAPSIVNADQLGLARGDQLSTGCRD